MVSSSPDAQVTAIQGDRHRADHAGASTPPVRSQDNAGVLDHRLGVGPLCQRRKQPVLRVGASLWFEPVLTDYLNTHRSAAPRRLVQELAFTV